MKMNQIYPIALLLCFSFTLQGMEKPTENNNAFAPKIAENTKKRKVETVKTTCKICSKIICVGKPETSHYNEHLCKPYQCSACHQLFNTQNGCAYHIALYETELNHSTAQVFLRDTTQAWNMLNNLPKESKKPAKPATRPAPTQEEGFLEIPTPTDEEIAFYGLASPTRLVSGIAQEKCSICHGWIAASYIKTHESLHKK